MKEQGKLWHLSAKRMSNAHLPETYFILISDLARIFSKRVWRHAQVLLIGAIVAPGERTATSVLRVMGLSDEQHFHNYHRILSRAV